ncbi:MAG: metallophosphoesterase [SAR324 cluster bacterium]|nr:metallophosphoesterase [SAR324 cluster bacterium]
MKRFVIIFFCFPFLSFSASPKLLAEEVNLLITSDLHGWLSSSYLYPNRKPKGLLHLEPHILALRQKYPDLLLLDGGDTMQGSALVTYANRFTPKTNPFFNKLTKLGYDAIAVGNHDIEENPTFEKFYGTGDLFLSANLYRDGKNAFKPYKIIYKQGLKIAILGLTTAGLPLWLPPEKRQGLKAKDMVSQAKLWVAQIRTLEKPDLLIALLHSGTNPFRGQVAAKSKGITPPNQAYKLLQVTKGIDFAVSGHDHRRIPYKNGPVSFIGSTPFVSAGHHATGLLHVTLFKENNHWKPKKATWFDPVTSTKINSKYQKSLSFGYKQWINQPLPFLLISKDKKLLAECLNQTLSLATKPKNLDGTLLPQVNIKSFSGFQKKRLTRQAFREFLGYDNSYFAIILSRRQLQLASQTSLSKQPRGYNQKLYLKLEKNVAWAKSNTLQSNVFQSQIFLQAEDFAPKYKVLVGGYHLSGGGGVSGRLFFPDFKAAKKIGTSLQSALISWMKQKPALPKACDGQLQVIN